MINSNLIEHLEKENDKLQADNKRLKELIGRAIIHTIGLDRDYVKCQKILEQALSKVKTDDGSHNKVAQ